MNNLWQRSASASADVRVPEPVPGRQAAAQDLRPYAALILSFVEQNRAMGIDVTPEEAEAAIEAQFDAAEDAKSA